MVLILVDNMGWGRLGTCGGGVVRGAIAWRPSSKSRRLSSEPRTPTSYPSTPRRKSTGAGEA